MRRSILETAFSRGNTRAVPRYADVFGRLAFQPSPRHELRMLVLGASDHAEVVPKMNQKYGNLYVQDSIPKATYRGMDADNAQATVMNILVAHETMDDKTAYNIVKAIFDYRNDLIAVHKEAENIKLENQKAAATPIPFHPGAAKYFAERGIKLN